MTFGLTPLGVALAKCSKKAAAQPLQMPNSCSSFRDARIRSVRARFSSASGLRERGGAVTIENTVSRSRAHQVQRGIPCTYITFITLLAYASIRSEWERLALRAPNPKVSSTNDPAHPPPPLSV
eukprot:3084421-Rhodomonas_salina.1